MSAFDCEPPLPREKDCPCTFAQDHSGLLLTEWLDRRRQTKQPPSPVSVAQEPIDFFRPNDQTIIECLIRHQVFGHFYRCEPNLSLSHQRVSGASNTENRREMASRRIEDGFGK